MAFATLSAAVSQSLQEAFVAKNLSVTIPDGGAFWWEGALKTRITETANSHFRANDGNLYDATGNTTYRAWTQPELQQWINQNTPGGEPTFDTFESTNRRCQIEIDGDTYTGIQAIGILSEAQADMEAFAKAIQEYVEAI